LHHGHDPASLTVRQVHLWPQNSRFKPRRLRAGAFFVGPRKCYTAPHESRRDRRSYAKLPPDQLARFRRWFNAFEAGRADHAKELDSTATKLGRLAGRAFAELKKRANET
jgi:hypothetical protein